MNLDVDYLQQWVGNTQTESERLDQWPVIGLMATLNRPASQWPSENDPLPPTAHWSYCIPRVLQSQIGADGHPERGDFLPPVPLPRRMWAGSRIRYEAPMPIGAQVTRTARIKTVTTKEGRSGLLAFVTVEHTYSCNGQIARIEEQDLVYRDHPSSDAPAPTARPAPSNPEWSQPIQTDEVTLFRYSAITFNGHRIHYDHPYVTNDEGYSGLVVHGPLIATFLLEAWQTANLTRAIRRFEFKAIKPVFCHTRLAAEGHHSEDSGRSHLWATSDRGELHMEAEVDWE